MNKFRLKQWHNLNDVEETFDKFDGGVDEYFEFHLNQIKEDDKYRIVTSKKSDKGFFLELSEGKFHTVKCTAELTL